jgi:putative flippase GtrA
MPATDPPRRTGRVRTPLRTLRKELGAFGVVGVACFVLDLAVFQVLYVSAGHGAITAKLLATVVSVSAAFAGHRYWTFTHRAHTGVRREYLLFAAVNAVTFGLSLAVVAVVRYPLGQTGALVLQAANVGAIGLGTVIRYLAYRAIVFPAVGRPHAGRTSRTAPDAGGRKALPPRSDTPVVTGGTPATEGT